MHNRLLAFRHSAAALAALTVLLGGCANPKAANEQNFIAAIRAGSARYDQRACTEGVTLPMNFSDRNAFSAIQNDTSKYDALLHVGLLQKRTSTVHHPEQFFQQPWTERITEYTITRNGAKYARKNSEPAYGGGDVVAFCYADKIPEKVTNFTVPGDLGGMTVSQARWTYALVGTIPDWAKNSEVDRAFPEVASTLAGEHTQEDTATLTLTNNGWEWQH